MESLEQRTLLTTGVLVLPDTTSPPSFGATVNVTEFGNTLNTTSDFNTSGGNFLGTFNGNQLSATYCLNLTLGISPPEEFDSANETTDGTIYGTPVPNAGAISWLLTNIGPTVTTLDQEAALQAAIWRTEYGPNGFQVNSVDNSDTTDTTGEEAIMQPFYQSYLQALGKNTAPVSSVDWISPDEDGMDQGLVALPTITAAPLTLGNLSPTQWQENQPGYDGTISVTGGTGGYRNLQVSGLPSGLSATVLSSTVNGQQSGTITISGTPTQSGTFTLTTTLQDGNGDTGSGTESLTITAAPLTLGNLSPTQWDVNEPGYDGTIAVSGGSGGYQNLQLSGLPSGLSAAVLSSTINGQQSGTITISGTPTQSGTFSLRVSIDDSYGNHANGKDTLTIHGVATRQSPNWAGYVAQTNLAKPASGAVTMVSGSWNMPIVKGAPGASMDAWVGIDGYPYTNHTVEQIGTTGYVDASTGKATYYAWHEMFPAAEVRIPITIHAGDAVSGSVTYNPRSKKFTLKISDATTRKTWSTQKPLPASKGAQESSAEWIVEDTGIAGGGFSPLANFGTVTFANAWATINGRSGPISNPAWQNQPKDIVSTMGTNEATTSALTTTGKGSAAKNSFTVTYIP